MQLLCEKSDWYMEVENVTKVVPKGIHKISCINFYIKVNIVYI